MDLSELENLLEAMDREHARAVAEFERDRSKVVAQIAELRRIAAKYKLGGNLNEEPPSSPTKTPQYPQPQASTAVQSAAFNGRVDGLIHSYLTDSRSPIHDLRHSTKLSYSNLLKRIEDTHGSKAIDSFTPDSIQQMHDSWADGDKKIAMAHSLITMFRSIVVFGASILKDDRCRDLAFILHRMKFKAAEPRSEQLSAEQAKQIIGKATERGLHSIALAQAFQFWCPLRQKDVIGEWVPITEQEESEVFFKHLKWVRGIRWEQIDNHFVLRHVTSKESRSIEISLGDYPEVMRLLLRGDGRKNSGPIIVSESTQRPWSAPEFRRHWRIIARQCGIPETVKNRDSGAGAEGEIEGSNDVQSQGFPAGTEHPRTLN